MLELTSKQRNDFLNLNHLQGADTSSFGLGLFFKAELVALASFKKTGTDWELSRFCAQQNLHVQGGAGKLISAFMKHHNPKNLNLISYVDARWSQGDLYRSLGFEFKGRSNPSYWYMHNYEKRIQKTKQDKLLTELKLAMPIGLDRIWDCGTTKWVLSWQKFLTNEKAVP